METLKCPCDASILQIYSLEGIAEVKSKLELLSSWQLQSRPHEHNKYSLHRPTYFETGVRSFLIFSYFLYSYLLWRLTTETVYGKDKNEYFCINSPHKVPVCFFFGYTTLLFKWGETKYIEIFYIAYDHMSTPNFRSKALDLLFLWNEHLKPHPLMIKTRSAPKNKGSKGED